MSIPMDQLKRVSLEKLGSYLERNGWNHDFLDRVNLELWYRGSGYEGASILIPAGRDAGMLEKAVQKLADVEGKSPLDILSEITYDEDDTETDSDQYRVQVVCDVFRAINTLIQNGGGSFRYLIYDLLGLPESAYGELMNAGGLGITNWIFEQIETNSKMRKVLKNALANAKREADGWNEIVRTIEDALSAGGEW